MLGLTPITFLHQSRKFLYGFYDSKREVLRPAFLSALAKGGYTLGLTPIAFLHQNRKFLYGFYDSKQGALCPAFLSALCKGGGIHAQHGWWVSSPMGCVSLQRNPLQRVPSTTMNDEQCSGEAAP